MRHLKEKCAGCEKEEFTISKEHFFPEWLILRTNTNNTTIRWGNKWLPALSCTIPLCDACNKLFGEHLESPVAHIFDEIETGKGLSDFEAELLIRWMWKFEGLGWYANPANKNWIYSDKYTLRERVLGNIDTIRPRLTLAISLIHKINPEHDDLPMGIDSETRISAIHVAGVFSKTAIIVSDNIFDSLIPPNFSIYHLSDKVNKKKQTKVFFPRTGFLDDDIAVFSTKAASVKLSAVHDIYALRNAGFRIPSI
jgi:hypothetical protein